MAKDYLEVDGILGSALSGRESKYCVGMYGLRLRDVDHSQRINQNLKECRVTGNEGEGGLNNDRIPQSILSTVKLVVIRYQVDKVGIGNGQ